MKKAYLIVIMMLSNVLVASNDLQTKSEISDTINLFFQKIDQKKFDEVEAMFVKDAVNVSVFGGQPKEMKSAHAIVDSWKQGLTPVKAVHHQVSNFIIDLQGKKAHMTFYGIANWYRPENKNHVTWFVGDYECDLVKEAKDWKITKLIYNNKFVNPPL